MRRGRRWLLVIFLAWAGAMALFIFPVVAGSAPIASRFVAKATCSCVFVSRRPEAVCTGDELVAQRLHWVNVRVDRNAQAVESSILGLWRGRASYRAGLGCTLQ